MITLLFLFATVVAGGSHLPSGITVCHRSKPDFPECIKKSFGPALRIFANGVKELGVPKLEPLYLESLVIPLRKFPSGSLEQKYKNILLHGLTFSTVEKAQVSLGDDCGYELLITSPVIRLEADYQFNGNLLLFPINGYGKCNITQYNLRNIHKMTCEKYKKNQETHLRMTNYSMVMETESLDYDFTNLVPGNEQISNEVLKTINDNPNVIFNEVRSAFEEVFSKIHMDVANNVLNAVPMDEIFLD